MKITQTKRHTDLFKPIRKGDRCTCAYLYGDGHATAVFERYDHDTGKRGTYYKQIDTLGISARFKGRIIFSGTGGGLALLRAALSVGCDSVTATAPSIDGGTPISKERGIKIGCVSLHTKVGDLDCYDMPAFMSGGCTFQDDVIEAFDPTIEIYGTSPIRETLIARVAPPLRLSSMG